MQDGSGSRAVSRRHFLQTAGVAAGGAVAGCLQNAPSASPGDLDEPAAASQALSDRPATIFRSDIERTGYWPEESVPADVELAWSIPDINKGDHTAAKASPLFYDGSVVTGGDVGEVFSFTPDGELEWSTALVPSTRGTHATPAIVGDLIFTTGYDGAVYAIDARDGDILWRSKVADAIGSSPVYYEGIVYIATEFYTPSGGMVALDATTGAIIWEDNRMTNHAHSQTAIDPGNQTFAAGCNDGHLYVWDLDSRAFRGTFETGNAIKGPICMHEGTAIFGSWDGNVYAVDTDSLEEIWRYEINDLIMAGASVHPPSGTVVIGSHDGNVYGLDRQTGRRRWDFKTGGWVVGSPTIVGDTVLAGSYADVLYALHVEDGDLRWRFDDPDGWVTGTPVVHDETIYVTERASEEGSGHLYKLVPA
jgi:outer membrane protein assembly factor BamB